MKKAAPIALVLLISACAEVGPVVPAGSISPAVTETQPAVAEATTMTTTTLPAIDPAKPEVLTAGRVIEGRLEPASGTNPTPAKPIALEQPKPPAASARTVEEFDTTTPEARAVAAAPAVPAAPARTGDGRLGTTVASLGAADDPGFWIKTPLVKERQSGRLYYAATGRNVQVQLIPLDGSSASGSQVSLAAMRLLDAPLTGLPEIVVYAN